MDTIIETSRLRLTRLTNTEIDSRDLQWFHENWTDESTTMWSLHGRTKTLQESQDWMVEHMTKYDNIFYAVHAKDSSNPEGVGEMVGSVSLRLQSHGPSLPPPNFTSEKPLNLRVIGYALMEAGRGKGYATEANRAMISAYSEYRKQSPEEVSYIEAAVDKENAGSIRVLEKLGFEKVGWKEEKEKVFLAGKWRDPGYWVYGLYV